MKTKSFQDYLNKRLNKQEIAEIKEQAQREIKILKSFQKILADMTNEYMEKNKGLKELEEELEENKDKITPGLHGES